MKTETSKRSVSKLGALALAVALMLPSAAFAGDLVSLVPDKAVAVGMVSLEELRTSPLGGRLFDNTDKITTDGEAAQFLARAGLDPAKDIDNLLIAVTPEVGNPNDGEILLVAEGRFKVDRLSDAVASEGAIAQAAHGKTYFLLPDDEDDDEDEKNGAAAFVSGSLAFAGTEQAVVDALGALAAGGTNFRSASTIGREMGLIDSKATAWLLLDVQRASRMKNSPTVSVGGGHEDKFGAAFKHVSTVGIWGRDAGSALVFGGTALTADSETRELLEDTIRGFFAMLRLGASEEHPEWVDVIRGFDVKRTSEGVSVTGSIPGSLLEKTASKLADGR